jgi:uncharacterized caspase-like protein
VAIQDYDDRSLSPLAHPIADAELLEQALVNRYRVPADQLLPLVDVSQVRLEQGIPNVLQKVQPNDQLILYFAGHAYQDDAGTVYLAPKNFNLERISASGLSLRWLVDLLEQCQANEKLLLLDCSHAGTGEDLQRQPSTAEMLQTLEHRPGRSPLRTVHAITSSSAGERGHVWPAKRHGLFAYSLVEGFSGRADPNRDVVVEPTELFAFLKQAMGAAAQEIQQPQSPSLFLADPTPPRLSDEAKNAIRRLAAQLQPERVDADAARLQYATAEALAAGELEPKLLYAMLLLKARQRDEALLVFDDLRTGHPDLLLPLQGIAWLHFERRAYDRGINPLVELISKLPKPEGPADPYPEQAAGLLRWAGGLREFAASADKESYRPGEAELKELDAAVDAHGPNAARHYQEGRDQTAHLIREIDERILTEDELTQSRLRVERGRVRTYASFPYDEAAQEILAGLDQ